MLSITFLYPSKRVGGAQLLFIRLAIELCKYDDIQVYVVDYPEGYLKSQLKDYVQITILPFVEGKVAIGNGTVLITPLSNFADLTYMVKGDLASMKFLFWSIHPSNLLHVLTAHGRKFFANKEKIAFYFQNFSESKHIIYMDEANFLAVNDLIKIEKKPEYLQIPLEIKEYVSKEKNKNEVINIAWLGRISYDKVYSIIKIIDEIKLIAIDNNVVFHIIGSGEKQDQLESYLKESGIKYVLKGVLEGDSLSTYMLENIDLGVAMGTSCMEFATRKIPVFLIDFSVSKFPVDVKYNWLFETQDYTLGSDVNSATTRNHTFIELINEYCNNDTLGEKCYQYVVKNHDIKKVTKELIIRCESLNSIDFSEFELVQKLLNPPVYRFVRTILVSLKNKFIFQSLFF